MRLTQDNKMIHTLAPDRSDQPFGKAILPRRGWCSRLVPDTHGAQSACDDGTVDPISIANEVLRGVIPRKGLCYLARNPFCRRVRGDADPDEVSAVEPENIASALRRPRTMSAYPKMIYYNGASHQLPGFSCAASSHSSGLVLRSSFSQWLRLLRAGGLMTPATCPLAARTNRVSLPIRSFERNADFQGTIWSSRDARRQTGTVAPPHIASSRVR